MTERRGADYMQHIKGNDEYYIISTLYSIGCILAYHRILLFEGIYSQIEYIYPKFGSLLLSKLDGFGNQLDTIGKRVRFSRYDRITLGDVITERSSQNMFISKI